MQESISERSKLEAEGVQQLKIATSATPVSKEQETGCIIHMASSELNNRRLEKWCLV